MPVRQNQSFAVTHVGRVRKTNEDAYVRNDQAGLWAVADGMGGHEAGEVASGLVADKLRNIKGCDRLDDLKSAAIDALNLANTALVGMANQFSPGRAAGSTVAVLLIEDDKGHALWAGDSRVYRQRDGKLTQLTTDHSHVQSLIDEELIRPEDAESHPMAHLITRAVGFDEPLALQAVELDARPDDRFLLCSDGLNRVLPESEICRHLSAASLEEAVQALLTATLDAGAPDNVTIVVVACNN